MLLSNVLWSLYSNFFDLSLSKLVRKKEGIILPWSLKPVSMMLVLWKLFGLLVSMTSTEVFSFIRLFNEKVSQRWDKKLYWSFVLYRIFILRSPMTINLSYLLVIWVKESDSSLKNVCLLLSCGGLDVKPIHRLLLDNVISRQIVLKSFPSRSINHFVIIPSFTSTIFPPPFWLRSFRNEGNW